MACIGVSPNLSTVAKTGSSPISGPVTISAGSGVGLIQFAQFPVFATNTVLGYEAVTNGVTGSTTKTCLFNGLSVAPIIIPTAGKLLAITISLDSTRSAGNCTARFILNGVSDTTNTAVIDGTNTQLKSTIFGTPVNVVAGDKILLETVPSSFAPTAADATVVVYFKPT